MTPRDHPVRFIYKKESRDILINRALLSHYTSFFEEKVNWVSDDNIYMLPFPINIAVECIDHIHSLFTQLVHNKNIHSMFYLLEGFDYFCVDVKDIYTHILSVINTSCIPTLRWTQDALRLEMVPLARKLLDYVYDHILSISIVFTYTSVDYPVLEFLLSRKWIIQPQTWNQTMNFCVQLERDLYCCVINYIEDVYTEEVGEIFTRIWKMMLPYHLSNDILVHLSNTRLAPFIQNDLRVLLDQKLKLFSSSTPALTVLTRFRLDSEHVDPTTVVPLQKIQVHHHTWRNGTVVSTTDNVCAIEIDTEEIVYVSMNDRYRLFPFQTIPVGKVCPCDGCIAGFRAQAGFAGPV